MIAVAVSVGFFCELFLFISKPCKFRGVKLLFQEKAALAEPYAKRILLRGIATREDHSVIKQMAMKSKSRITILSLDGVPLVDSDTSIKTMTNHKLRPEVIMASKLGESTHRRMSQTLAIDMYYYAKTIQSEDSTIGYLKLAYDGNRLKSKASKASNLNHWRHGIWDYSCHSVWVFMGCRISRPVRELTDACGKLISGNQDHVNFPLNKSEFSILSKALPEDELEL